MLDHRGGQRLLPCLFRLNWSETHGPDCTVRIPLFIPWSSHVYWDVKWPVPFLSLKGKRSWLWTVEFNTHHSCVIWISLECGPWDSTLGTPKTVYWEPALGEALNPSQGDWTGVTTTPGLLKSKAALQLVTLQLLRMLSSALCGNRELKEIEGDYREDKIFKSKPENDSQVWIPFVPIPRPQPLAIGYFLILHMSPACSHYPKRRENWWTHWSALILCSLVTKSWSQQPRNFPGQL